MLYHVHAGNCKCTIHRFRVNAKHNLLNYNFTSAFYGHVNTKLNALYGAAPLHNATLLINNADKACTFNNFFSSIFLTLILLAPLSTNLASTHISDKVDFSPAAVLMALGKAQHFLSTGLDIVPVHKFPISVLYMSSQGYSVLPSDWK